jgi:ABC-2 type transport system ATP-binding protein
VLELRDAGTSIVVTTHSFEEAARLADHLVIMNGGRTVAEGSPSEVTRGAPLEDVYFGLTTKGRS